MITLNGLDTHCVKVTDQSDMNYGLWVQITSTSRRKHRTMVSCLGLSFMLSGTADHGVLPTLLIGYNWPLEQFITQETTLGPEKATSYECPIPRVGENQVAVRVLGLGQLIPHSWDLRTCLPPDWNAKKYTFSFGKVSVSPPFVRFSVNITLVLTPGSVALLEGCRRDMDICTFITHG